MSGHRPWLICGFLIVIAGPLFAHGGRLPLVFWGGFPRNVARCQQAIGWAARACAADVARLYLACPEKAGPAEECSDDRQAQRRDVIVRRVLDQIGDSCGDQAARQLGFLSLIEAQGDIASACTRVERASKLLLAPTSATAARNVSDDDSCKRFANNAALKLLRFATLQWRAAFDRMAYRLELPSTKQALIKRVRARVELAATKLARLESRFCRPGEVSNRYGHPFAMLLGSVAQLGECVAGAAYVQDAVHCDDLPLPP